MQTNQQLLHLVSQVLHLLLEHFLAGTTLAIPKPRRLLIANSETTPRWRLATPLLAGSVYIWAPPGPWTTLSS